ncbi:MAG: hypothetical protein ACYC7D_07210 [Nitrososphaerales archaeon]
MTDRASRYAKITRAKSSKQERDTLILAHVGRTSKRKLRLLSVGIVIKGGKEAEVSDALPENDPRYVADSDFAIRKITHDLVRASGRFSKFYDSIVKIDYTTDQHK